MAKQQQNQKQTVEVSEHHKFRLKIGFHKIIIHARELVSDTTETKPAIIHVLYNTQTRNQTSNTEQFNVLCGAFLASEQYPTSTE